MQEFFGNYLHVVIIFFLCCLFIIVLKALITEIGLKVHEIQLENSNSKLIQTEASTLHSMIIASLQQTIMDSNVPSKRIINITTQSDNIDSVKEHLEKESEDTEKMSEDAIKAYQKVSSAQQNIINRLNHLHSNMNK
tara:strand:+ start:1714 stop:2124 length:411 start_codon:yes stop_codon:yes gene_type:complete